MSTGRNFAEILRAIDSLQLTAAQPVATRADWAPGNDVIVSLALDDDVAKERFGELRIVKSYLRYTADPSAKG
jgi:alkyl hydroperoxide reductase subunit AhpC